ncbi:MAG TPA: permease prefix domain 1-containing protein [Vicinamibacterales bacterium]|nr:permease prefix domain 1-containing protein [Vicinamibacterales bacterium]
MTPGPLDAYLQALASALHERGHAAARIVAEAREHLADAVEDGLRRGLTREDAEREAVERFGPPDLIAAQAPPVSSRTMSRLTTALDTIVGNWRWMTGATAVAALLAGTVSYYVMPAFYRSESMIAVIPQPRVSPGGFDMRRDSQERMQAITTAILSDARLDPILKDFGLGTVEKVRRNISVEIAPRQPDTGDAIGAFTVAFQSPDPRLSQRVTERLTSLFIIENLEDQERAGRAIGDQFRVTKAPNLPTGAQRPGMAKMTVSGAFAGLALSIVALVWRKD